ncbi:MAG: hypothetical protein J5J00_15430 [Deltaproteobacteria bacterium]|nr:hypothetical protein [Deltaproteobacteria bacterium]
MNKKVIFTITAMALGTAATLVSASFGARIDITNYIIFGAAYQIPLTNGAGSKILDYRVTTDLIFKL